MKIWDFASEFIVALIDQLKQDDLRWGDTWLKRTRKGQTERTIKTYRDYFDQYEQAGTPVNWLKVAGGAMICWVRDQHPEIWKE